MTFTRNLCIGLSKYEISGTFELWMVSYILKPDRFINVFASGLECTALVSI